MMAARPFTAAAVILLALLCAPSAAQPYTSACDTTLNAGLGACQTGTMQACCAALAAYNTGLCLCPGYQTRAPASAITQAQSTLPLCSLTPATCPAAPATPSGSPSNVSTTLPGPVWAYAVLVSPTGLKVAWSFPPATVFISFDLRRSGDPTFPTATTISLSALPAVNFTSGSDPAGVYGNFDALVARFGAPGQLYYAVRGNTISGQTTAWSAPFAAFNATVPGTLFAAPGGATGQCGSFIAPCGAIQDGLDAASTGSTLLLLPGTYSGPRNRGLTMSGKGIRVLGLAGSAGTTLNCSLADRGFAFTSGESISAGAAVQGLTIMGGLAYAGAGMVFSGASAAVSDVTITNCKADGSGTPLAGVTAQAGGGVSISNGNATFDRCTLSNNAAGTNGGGGLYVEGTSVSVFTNMLITGNVLFNPGRGGNVKLIGGPSPTFINVTITSGNGGLFAGGLWSDTGAPVLTNVTVSNNIADYGAGMVVSQGSSLVCNACVITSNAATQFGGGAVTGGGTTGLVVFRNSVFANNTAAVQGGGIYVAATSTTTIANVSFTNNTAPNGAGLFIDTSTVTMSGGTSVTGNAAGALGGGIWCKTSTVTLAPGTLVAGNTAAGSGGGLYTNAQCNVTGSGVTITGGHALNGGGVYMLSGSSVNLTASSITNNAAGTLASATASSSCGASATSSASSGGGVYMAAPSATSTGAGPALVLTACTLTSNTAAGDGGGITVLSGRAVLTAGSVANNIAGGDGGGVAVKSQGQAVLAAASVLSNTAGGNGGGIAFGVTSQPGLVAVYGGSVSGNTAGNASLQTGLGGGLYLAWPAYVVQGATVANNSAYTGGGLSIAADFGTSQTACRLAAALQLPCSAPLLAVVLSGNNASAGLSLFWLRASSPGAVVACTNCTLPWPLRPSDLATEPLSLGFATPPATSVQTGSVMAQWSIALQDYYASAAATYAATCTLATGAPLGGVAVSDATRLTVENNQAVTALGVAAFNSTPHGLVGTTYPLQVTCTLTAAATALPPVGFNITVAPCAAGTQVSSDGRSCDACKANAEFNLQAGGTCRPCPLGGACPTPTVLQALPDWWRSTNTSTVLFNCPLAGACLPGQPAGDAACLPGYGGPVCAVCAPGYYPWGKVCKACDPAFNWSMPLVGAVAAVAFVCMFALPVKTDNVDPVVRAKLVMTFLQVQGLIKDYAITWRPKLLLGALSYFDVLNIGLEITAPACGKAPLDFYSTYLTTMMLPPAALGLCAAVWAAHRWALRGPWRQARPQPFILFGRVLLPPRAALSDDQVEVALDRFTTRCLKNAAWLVLLLYPGVCKKVMQLYGTRTLDTGAFLRSDYSIQTRDVVFHRTAKYSRYASGGIVMTLLYPAGIPLLFAVAVRLQSKRAAAKGMDLMDSFVGFLAAGYSPKAVYWELLELLRKLAMAAIGVFAVDGAFNGSHAPDVSGALSAVVQPFLGQMVTVSFLATLLYVQPYERRIHNVVQAYCLITTWACLLVGDSLFNTATQTGAIRPGQQDGIGIWLGVLLCLWVAAILLWALDGWARDMWGTLTSRFPHLFVRAGSQAKVVPLMLDAEAGGHHRGSSSVTAADVGADDAAHAKALAQIDVHDLARQPRVADGDKYQPAKLVVGAADN